MSLQTLPKTAADTGLKLVRLPAELVTKVREQFGGDTDTVKKPAKPTKAKTAKPKATKKPAAKPKPSARKPAAKNGAAAMPASRASVDRARDQLKKFDD